MGRKGAKHRDRVQKAQAGNWLYNSDHYASKVKFNPKTGCQEWVGVQNNIGYGFVGVRDVTSDKGKMVTAHRLALTIKLGRAIAPGMNANHTCHNRLCCTPEHLYEGTQREKLDRMRDDNIKMGRTLGVPTGGYDHQQVNRKYKYTVEEIKWVRDADVEQISLKYNVDRNRAHAMRYAFRIGYRWLPWNK